MTSVTTYGLRCVVFFLRLFLTATCELTSNLFIISYQNSIFSHFTALPHEELQIPQMDIPKSRKNFDLVYDLVEQPKDTAPVFSFGLRHRTIQRGIGVKLLCCFDGRPPPTCNWSKDGREITKQNTNYNITTAHGVSTLEIFACEAEDEGTYRCVASNKLGEFETSCKILVQGMQNNGSDGGGLYGGSGGDGRQWSTGKVYPLSTRVYSSFFLGVLSLLHTWWPTLLYFPTHLLDTVISL